MKTKLLSAGLLGLGSVVMAASASAADPTDVTGAISFDGERACICEVEMSNNTVNFGDLGNRGQAAKVTLQADVFCNRPSDVTLTSTNGYMLINDSNALNKPNDPTEVDLTSGANPGFSGGLNYSVFIPKYGVGADTTSILALNDVTIGTVPALNENNLNLVFDTIAEPQPLLGGDYSDSIIWTISPQGL